MTVWYDTTAVFGDGDVVLRTVVVVTVCVHVVLRGAADKMEDTTARWRSVVVVLGQSGTEIRPVQKMVATYGCVQGRSQCHVLGSRRSRKASSF